MSEKYCGSTFVAGSEIEKPLVLFDKTGVIRFVEQETHQVTLEREARLANLRATLAQAGRADKYVQHGEFLEALAYYHKCILAPLVEMLLN